MEHVGMDLGKKESQIAILTEAGELIEKRMRTERDRLVAYFKDWPQAKILMEASTVSEWVARLLEELGHEVVVADPNYAPMYAQRSRRVKTDRRDALALAEACRLGAYRPAHRTSEEQRHVRAQLAVRDSLVRDRAGLVTLAQAILSREGLQVPTGSSGCFGDRVERLGLPEPLAAEIAPLLAMLVPFNEQIGRLDAKLSELGRKDERVKRLMTMPEIGPVTAVAFVATLDEAGRFRGGAPGGSLPRVGAAGVELERGAEARPHHQVGQPPHALAARGSGMARGHPQEAAGDAGAAGVDGAHRPPPRPARRRRGPGPQAQRNPLRDVEGRLGLRPREAERHPAQQGRAGGLRTQRREPCVTLS
jgi:transposase